MIATDDLDREIDPDTECYCDFVQILEENGERVELHHVVPDDGLLHSPDPECGCGPAFQRLETDLVVVEHRDADGDVYPELFDEPDEP